MKKKLLLLACVPGIIENYHNIQKLLSHIDFSVFADKIRYAMDLKMANILTGQQGHSSTFPCHHCTWKHPQKGNDFIAKTGYQPQKYLRTLGNQKLLATAFSNATGANKVHICELCGKGNLKNNNI